MELSNGILCCIRGIYGLTEKDLYNRLGIDKASKRVFIIVCIFNDLLYHIPLILDS